MNSAGTGIHNIMVDFYNQSKTILNRDVNAGAVEIQVWTNNRNVLKSFFICVEICCENNIRDKYTDAVKNYFIELEQFPINGLHVLTLMSTINGYLETLENDDKYKMYLKILDEYIWQ